MPNFTQQQQAAVNLRGSQQVVVVAAAGSGKTSVLVERIARLIFDDHVDPHRCLVLTFTRHAAWEMHERLQQRLAELTGADGRCWTRGLTIGTFHSWCLSLLRRFSDDLSYRSAINVCDAADSEMLWDAVAIDLGYAKRSARGITWKGGQSKAKLLKAYLSEATPSYDELVLAHEYESRLSAMSTVDYEMIVRKAYKLLVDNEAARKALQEQYTRVLVDETQDCDILQIAILNTLCPPAEMFAVGDARQSIYGFRGARPDAMLTWAERQTASVVDLPDCFRCPATIVDAANKLISHAAHPFTPMMSQTGRQGLIDVITGRSADVVLELASLHDTQGWSWKQMAVLARNHRTLERLERIAAEHGVPVYRVGGGFDICSSDEFRVVHAFLRMVHNTCDLLAAERLKTFQSDFASREQAIRVADLGTNLITVRDVLSFIEPEAKLSRAIAWWMARYASDYLEAALYSFATRDSQDDLPEEDEDRVTLCTAHAAKGLEWPVVLIVGLNEGDWPAQRAIDEGQIEEERRLFYVAMTRTKQTCLVHFRREEDQAKDRPIKEPSRFIEESGLVYIPF